MNTFILGAFLAGLAGSTYAFSHTKKGKKIKEKILKKVHFEKALDAISHEGTKVKRKVKSLVNKGKREAESLANAGKRRVKRAIAHKRVRRKAR